MFIPLAFHKESIVTRGLIIHLDAADRTSYSPISTQWNDLSGNDNIGVIKNGSQGSHTFTDVNGGSLNFDSQYMNNYPTPPQLEGDPSFTICGFFKKTGDWNQGATWGIGGGSGQSLKGINSFNHNNQNNIAIDLWGTSTYSTGEEYTDDWKFVAWRKKAGSFTTSNISIHVNETEYTGGNLIVLRGGSGTPNINNTGIFLGRAGNQGAYYSKVSIAKFMVYNRMLSPTEVIQNYNADKARFGIL